MQTPSTPPQPSPQRASEPLDLHETIGLSAVVHGTVQGVGFRRWCWQQAQELGLVGSATNNDDGTVSVLAEGPRWAVGEFLQALISRDTPGAVITVDEHFGPATHSCTEFTTH